MPKVREEIGVGKGSESPSFKSKSKSKAITNTFARGEPRCKTLSKYNRNRNTITNSCVDPNSKTFANKNSAPKYA